MLSFQIAVACMFQNVRKYLNRIPTQGTTIFKVRAIYKLYFDPMLIIIKMNKHTGAYVTLRLTILLLINLIILHGLKTT